MLSMLELSEIKTLYWRLEWSTVNVFVVSICCCSDRLVEWEIRNDFNGHVKV